MRSPCLSLAALAVAAIAAVACTGCFGKSSVDDTAAVTTTAAVTETTAAATTAAAVYPFTGYVNATTLNVRPSANTEGYAIGGLTFGDAVTVIAREGDWYQINFGSGTGYVSAQYIQNTPPVSLLNETTASTVTTAETAAETTAATTAP